MIKWADALILIKQNIKKNTDLNTNKSIYRIVDDVSSASPFWCHVRHGVNNAITITEDKLEKCFKHATSAAYNRVYQRQVYADLFGEPNYPCEVNIIGMIFEVSGFATSKKVGVGNHYQIM